jgi:hypothetical protein
MLELEALIRSPLLSHTTEAGLGASLMGQLGGGGGGGVWTTGAVASFLDDRCERAFVVWDFIVAGDAGEVPADCAPIVSTAKKLMPVNDPASNPHCSVAATRMRFGRVASMEWNDGIQPPVCLGEVCYRLTALDYQWPSNAHRVFAEERKRNRCASAGRHGLQHF